VKTIVFALLMAFLFTIGSVLADCPPVIMNEKLHGILPLANHKVTYSEVVDCGSVSQADLFRRSRLWIAQSFHSAKDTFALSDKETGDLISRSTQVVTLPRSESSAGGVYSFRYSLVVECTNRKYRVTINQIDLEESATSRPTPIETYCQKNDKELQMIYTELDKQLKSVLTAFQENVKNYKAF
jgi:hypothetical protein